MTLPWLALTLLFGPAFAAEGPMPPRLGQAAQTAAQEKRAAEARLSVAPSSGPVRASAQAAVARARAWEEALKEAATAARPQDSDLVAARDLGAQLVRGGETLPLKPGTALREGDQVAVAEGRAELRFHDGSLLVVGPSSSLRVLQAPRAVPQQSAFTLERGRVYWQAPTEGLTGLARVMTPRAAAQLRAGRAEVSVDAAGEAALSVYEGTAELSAKPGVPPPGGWWDQIELDSK
ncbi:MAG: FecR domain-containing protein [Elusimicrobia bacterium]|nr:FecR domain-containing protein [Elusimicrobiota bacterium]